jgi:hypothetical protein
MSPVLPMRWAKFLVDLASPHGPISCLPTRVPSSSSTSIRHAQRFLSAFSGISPHFRPRRHLLSAADYRQVMADRFAVWNEITGATTTAAA